MSAILNENVIPFEFHGRLTGEFIEEKTEKLTKSGEVKKTTSNKVAGVSSEVYPFYQNEIDAIINVFNNNISNAKTDLKVWSEKRNKLLFVLGINLGIRASDLRLLKWNFFFNEDSTWKDSYTIMPLKTSNKRKFVKLFFNDAVKKAINDFVEEYPIGDLDSYIFVSPKKQTPITVQSIWNIVTDVAEEAGIKKNIGTHSLRKTFGYHAWRNAEDKAKALVILQNCFNHSTTIVTQRYIGIMDNEIKDMFQDLNLGYSEEELFKDKPDVLLMIDDEEPEEKLCLYLPESSRRKN